VSNKTTGCENNTTQFVADNSVIPVLSFASIFLILLQSGSSFNGSLTAQVNNIPAGFTIADYTFKWYDGNSNAAAVDGTSTSTLLNKLDAGFYTVDGKNTKTGLSIGADHEPGAECQRYSDSRTAAPPVLICQWTQCRRNGIVSISNIQAGDAFTYQGTKEM